METEIIRDFNAGNANGLAGNAKGLAGQARGDFLNMLAVLATLGAIPNDSQETSALLWGLVGGAGIVLSIILIILALTKKNGSKLLWFIIPISTFSIVAIAIALSANKIDSGVAWAIFGITVAVLYLYKSSSSLGSFGKGVRSGQMGRSFWRHLLFFWEPCWVRFFHWQV